MKESNFKIKTVFVDIDATLVDQKPEYREKHDRKDDVLTVLVAERNKISYIDAQSEIEAAVENLGILTGKYWPFGILGDFNLSEGELWSALEADAKQRYFMYPDARSFLIKIKQFFPALKVYTATTNPRMIILAKLSVEKLAGQNGSPYLDGAFGGEEVYPGGKAKPEFFGALLERTGAASDTTLIVGDSPEKDLSLAKSAGLKHVILPRRSQREEWIHENDGGIYVKSLDAVFQFLFSPFFIKTA